MKIYRCIIINVLFLFMQLACVRPVCAQAIETISPVLRKLITTNKRVDQIGCIDLSGLIIPTINNYSDNEKYLIKTEDGLYIGIDGTGVLFQIQLIDNIIVYYRVDNTFYSGSNFLAAHFSYHNKIYSFGGYGFWKSNGALRSFNPISKEWDINPISDEKSNLFCMRSSGIKWSQREHIPTMEMLENVRSMSSLFWLDAVHGTLFTIGQRSSNETIRGGQTFDPSIEALDLSNGSWKKIGKLKQYGWSHYVALPQGLLIHESNNITYVADLIHNSILYPDAYLKKELSKLNSGSDINIIYAIDSTIYFGNIRNNSIDSINISQKHLLSKNVNYFDADMPTSVQGYPKVILIGSIVVFLIFSIFLFSQIKHSKKFVVQNQNFETNVSNSNLVFTEIEKNLILLLSKKSLKGDTASIEVFNKIIGVASKPEQIKRKVRSEIIQSINFKWGLLTQSKEKLIISTRSFEDKRSREYYILENHLSNPILTDLL